MTPLRTVKISGSHQMPPVPNRHLLILLGVYQNFKAEGVASDSSTRTQVFRHEFLDSCVEKIGAMDNPDGSPLLNTANTSGGNCR
jgi:hypothetical protein